MATTDRRSLLAAAAGAGGIAAGLNLSPARAAEAVSIGATFLRSLDPDPASLVRFIDRNWFAMDKIARERGLMTDYALHVASEPAPDWNVLVLVGYPTADGYAAIAEAFDAIRKAHVVEPVDGKTRLQDLGVIVRSATLAPGPRS